MGMFLNGNVLANCWYWISFRIRVLNKEKDGDLIRPIVAGFPKTLLA